MPPNRYYLVVGSALQLQLGTVILRAGLTISHILDTSQVVQIQIRAEILRVAD